MPTIGNKRVTQLVELTASELTPDDLFLVIDYSAKESKRIKTSELGLWLNNSGSVYAFHSVTSDTASFILGSGVYGLVSSASMALISISALSASWASQSFNSVSSSNALTASFALNSTGGSTSASFLIYAGFPNGTASYALKSGTSDLSSTTQFLIYTGGNNGTASHAITSRNVINAITADTASYLNTAIAAVSSASWANIAGLALTANTASVSNFLAFSPFNGTASYAISAGSINQSIIDYGVFNAITQSLSSSQLDNVFINSSLVTQSRTSIEAVGTIVIPFTSSIPVNESISLIIKDRYTGIETTIDSTPVYYALSPTVGNWGAYNSGSIKIPYTMLGTSNLYGNYMFFISASSDKIYIEPTRINKFNISSLSDNLTVNSGTPLEFSVVPSGSIITFRSTTPGGPYTDIAYNMVHTTGSSNILSINLDGLGVTNVNYIWDLSNLLTASFVGNTFLSDLGTLPSTIKYLDFSGCNAPSVSDLSQTALSYLKCTASLIPALPSLPPTMSYIDCSNNGLSSLPLSIPVELKEFYCNGNQITSVLQAFPNSIVSMSFANNPLLTNFGITFPTSLVSFNINNSPVGFIPQPKSNLRYIYAATSSLSNSTMDNICSQSVVNAVVGLHTGSINITGNGPPLPSTLNYINELTTTWYWTVLHD